MLNFLKKLVTKKQNVYELDLDQDFENEYFDNSDLGETRNPSDTELKLLRSKVNAILYPEAEELLTSTDNSNELDVFEEIIQLESLTSEPEKPSDVFQGSQAHPKPQKEFTAADFTMYEEDEYVDTDNTQVDNQDDKKEFDSTKLFETETQSEIESNEEPLEADSKEDQNSSIENDNSEEEANQNDFSTDNNLEPEQESEELISDESDLSEKEPVNSEDSITEVDIDSEDILSDNQVDEIPDISELTNEDQSELEETLEIETDELSEDNIPINEINSEQEEAEEVTIDSTEEPDEVPEAVESTTSGIEEDDTEDDLDLFESGDENEAIPEIPEEDDVNDEENETIVAEEIAFEFDEAPIDLVSSKDDLEDVEGVISFEDEPDSVEVPVDLQNEPIEETVVIESEVISEMSESAVSDQENDNIEVVDVNDTNQEVVEEEFDINSDEETIEIEADENLNQTFEAESEKTPALEETEEPIKEDHSLVGETESQIAGLHSSYSNKMNQFKEKVNDAIDFIDQQSKTNFTESDSATILKSFNWLKDSADNFQLFYLSNFLNQLIHSFEIKEKHPDFDISKIASYPSRENLTADEEHLITAVNEIAQINSIYEKAGRKSEERFTNTELSANKDRLIPGKVKKINRAERKRVVLTKN